MKKTLLFILCFGCLLAGGMWAQQKAQIRIKKNINGVESEETREVIIDNSNSLEDVLRDLNAQPSMQEGVIDQQLEISILSEGEPYNFNQDKRTRITPGFSFSRPNQRKATLGVMLREAACKQRKCSSEMQVIITEVIPNTPAAKAGLQNGDVILTINKLEITTTGQVIDCVQQCSLKGGELKMTIERNGKRKKLKAIIEPSPVYESKRDAFNLMFGTDSITMFNLEFGDSMKILQPFNLSQQGLSAGESAFLGVTPSGKPSTSGVSIHVEENSPAEEMGLIDDDIILEFNGQAIGDFTALSTAVRQSKPETTVEILILRDNKEKRLTGVLGKRKLSAAEDFQIFHDYKGMDDEGNYFYDFEFNMDADDLQRQMQEFFRSLNGSAEIYPFTAPGSNSTRSLLRLEDVDAVGKSKLEISDNTLSFEQLMLIPDVINGALDVAFNLPDQQSVTVTVQDEQGHTLLYDEKPISKEGYKRTIRLNAYPEGNYYLVIRQGNKSFAKQIVKYPSE
jgi:C-terminal processing protease CtpA/Prc